MDFWIFGSNWMCGNPDRTSNCCPHCLSDVVPDYAPDLLPDRCPDCLPDCLPDSHPDIEPNFFTDCGLPAWIHQNIPQMRSVPIRNLL
jgi:hypothetical protein